MAETASRIAPDARSRLIVFLTVMAFLVATELLPTWSDASRALFDRASTLAPPKPATPGYVIVAIDEPSFSAIGKPWPWPRELHARLLQSLRKAGARAIAADIVFAEATTRADDDALAAAADRNTVLAADETLQDSPQGTMLIRTTPAPELLRTGARVGVTSVPLDPDGVVRRIPRYPDSLPRQMLRISGDRGDAPNNAWIQYFGPRGTYPTVSYYQALDPDRYLPPNFFKGRDVMVGFALQTAADAARATDAFETPFSALSGDRVPGVEIHATIADNLRHRLWITPAPRWVAALMLVLGCLAGYAAAAPDSLPRRFALLTATAAAMLVALWLSLRLGRVWISPAEPLTALAASFAALGITDVALERRRRRHIQAAFGQYLAPAVVDRLIADPGSVKLLGERKCMSILFADVRGFTTISETMKDQPEEITSLINHILSPLSEIVLDHRGTIDKYIGDCIMAFWNAPIDDADHASHAVAAAIDMVAALPALNARLRDELGEGAPSHEIAIGVGVNSGECIVGNMGTEKRFDYTVVGDAVNVASRLESLSKDYMVPILVGEATVALAADRFAFTEVDTVAVRGTKRPQKIYTVKGSVEGGEA